MSPWSHYGLQDPLIPFSEQRLEALLGVLKEGASDSANVIDRTETLRGWRGDIRWTGEAADAYFKILGELPEDLSKLVESYGLARDAVRVYLEELRRLRKEADHRLEVVERYESKIRSLESQLHTMPPEDEAGRRSIEQDLASMRDGQSDMVGDADSLRNEVEHAAARFARSIDAAVGMGIQNRGFLERFYQENIEGLFETVVFAWEKLSLVVGVVALACWFIPFLQPIALALTIMNGMVLTMRAVDIALSDDDIDLAFVVDAAMAVVGVKAGLSSTVAARSLSAKGLSGFSVGIASDAGRFVFYTSVAVIVEGLGVVKDIGHPVHEIITTPETADNSEAARAEDASPRYRAELTDDIWTLDSLQILPLVTSPLLLDIEVDTTPSNAHDRR